MSFRSYLSVIDNSKLKEIKDLSLNDIYRFFNTDNVVDFIFKFEIIFEFGSYSDYDEYILKNSSSVFSNKEAKEKLAECYLRKISEKQFLNLIEKIRQNIGEYFDKLSSDERRIRKYIENKKTKWNESILVPYNLNKKTKNIIDDDSLEYNIFELINIYKKIDFTKQTLLFIGR